ncbi:MAG: gamma-glutamylcyclotransferase [Litoreibacter sp.]|nr:gamma-glutamylcyclotransferase [Litoreibacter sp.]
MTDPFFFGYGSLVNTRTHDYGTPTPARLSGWRRVWRHTHLREVAFLSARPDPDSQIDGLIAHVPGADWEALDLRERAYNRTPLDHAKVDHALDRPLDVQIYQTDQAHDAPPSVRHPILLSYIDVVVQGYLSVFGEAGVTSFFETTDGWAAPILDDRATPRYTRHQKLSSFERELVDQHLRGLPAEIEKL